jgi:LSD1 subclass zinc finger protein
MLILDEIRCPSCNRKLMELSGQAQTRCGKCKALVRVDTAAREIWIEKEPKK